MDLTRTVYEKARCYRKLMEAATAGDVESTLACLSRGDDPNMTGSGASGRTALHNAAARGHYECVKHLLAANANVNALNAHGMAPLFLATQQEHTRVVIALVEAGASSTERASNGWTASEVASHEGGDTRDCIARFLGAVGTEGERATDKYPGPMVYPLSWCENDHALYTTSAACIRGGP